MIVDTNNGKKQGQNVELTLEDTYDCLGVTVNGYEIVIRRSENGVNIDVSDNTLLENYAVLEEYEFFFKDLFGRWPHE